jgi:nicotinamide-nucleotide amidase
MQRLNLQVLLTGNELMLGDIVDSNSVTIAHQLNTIGLEIERKVTVGDNLTCLVNNIIDMSKQADILIINGGLGPTVDDLTAQALAQATGNELTEHKQALAHLSLWCKQRDISLSYPNLKQVYLPKNSRIIDNPIGSAVGFVVTFQECDIYCTPGVPTELKNMIINEILPIIKRQLPHSQSHQVIRSQVFGYGESGIQSLIFDNIPEWPKKIDLGFRADTPFIEVKLACQQLEDLPLLHATQSTLTKLLGDHVLAIINKSGKTMAEYVLDLLIDKQLKITLAESCTGGLIASQLTNIAGASKVFEAGFITYSNSMKTTLLEVKPKTLTDHGAVSKAVALEMAKGALNKTQADIVIAVTGIAGPSGGTIDKPVGSVWIAWGNNEQLNTHYFCIKGQRKTFQNRVVNIALDLIRRMLLKSTQKPFYMAT